MGLLAKLKATSTRKDEDTGSNVRHPTSELVKKRYTYPGGKNFRAGNPARDFYIQQEAPHHIWKPNEYICGEAVLVLKRDVENVAVTFSLVGEIKLRGLGPRTRSEKLFEKSTTVYGENEETALEDQPAIVNGLTKGEHRFPFRLKVPSKKIFTSIKFERGSISYYMQCTLQSLQNGRADEIMATCEKSVSVMVPLDVGRLPKPKTKTVVLQSPSSLKQTALEQDCGSGLTRRTGGSKQSESTMVTTGSNSKTVTINVDLPASGYVVGEVIPVQLHLAHYREYSHSTGLIATLVRICRVEDNSKENVIETFRKDMCQTVSPVYVDPETLECSTTVYLKVPLDAFPTLRLPNRRFSFQYYVEVLVNLSRKNLAYTESNRVVDPTSNSQGSSHPSKSIEETLSVLQRKIQAGSANNGFHDDDRESMIFFKDLINVDKLKRLRNVTGMSIEIVVGTTKTTGSPDIAIPGSVADQNQTTSQTTHGQSPVNSSNSEETSHLEAQDYTYTATKRPTPSTDTSYLFEYDEKSTMPLPEYTPNSLFEVAEDKDEMELQRLKDLESEPSMAL
ncbi:LAFA_0A03290g1_1 [Lachancea sp. 'fantastica']|nr:LAFA_0A03290g1_1 [Lachancea sp. 'fantastica']